jgi:hypothetical protein
LARDETHFPRARPEIQHRFPCTEITRRITASVVSLEHLSRDRLQQTWVRAGRTTQAVLNPNRAL